MDTITLKETLSKQFGLQEHIQAVEKATSLQDIITAAWKLIATLVTLIVEEIIIERAKAPTAWPLCTQCGRRLVSKGFYPRRIISIFGAIQWQRRVGRCPNGCQIGQVAPLDKALQIEPYQMTCNQLKRLACLLAVFLPFETAAFLLNQCLGISVSGDSIWNWVRIAGSAAKQQLEEELRQLGEGQGPSLEELAEKIKLLPLLIGGDGVMVPFRPNPRSPAGKTRWQEVKVGILARLSRRVSKTGKMVAELVHKRVVAVLGDTEAFGIRLLLEALRQNMLKASQVLWVSDGARGLWKIYTSSFAIYSIGVLDFYHATQNLWKATAAWLDGRTTHARHWFDKARHELRHSQCVEVINNLKEAMQIKSLPDGAKATIQQVVSYLETHRDHMDYKRLKEMGLPIGSGFVESTCKWLIQQRFKGVGMRWSVDGFNNLLHLRLAYVNGHFDSIFQNHASPNL